MKRRRFTKTGLALGMGLLAGCSGGVPMGGGSSGGSGATGPGGIAVPSGFEGATAPPVPQEEVTIARYTGSGSSEEAIEAFKSAAEDEGWEGHGTVNVMGGKWSGVGFEKEDEALVIHAEESEEEVVVTVIHAPKDRTGMGDTEESTEETETQTEETEDEYQPPESDVGGSDIEDVPRYPGSVRTEYGKQESDGSVTIAVKYTVKATFEEVSSFYEDALPKNGWTIGRSMTSDEGGGIIATKGSKQVTVSWEKHNYNKDYVDIGVYMVGSN